MWVVFSILVTAGVLLTLRMVCGSQVWTDRDRVVARRGMLMIDQPLPDK